MRTIRRIYFYLVTFISVLTLVWGITNLLRSITDQQITGSQSSILSAGLAQVLVSIPIFLLHWFIVQKDAKKSEEDRNSLIRAVFLYAVLISLLIPVVQNFIAMLNRLLLQSTGLSPERALFGGYQSLSDNLIAIAVNLMLASYFAIILRADWVSSHETENLVDVRRLYRYIWMLYSIGLTIIGTQKLVVFILAWQHSIGSNGREQLVNAVTLIFVGVPIWVYWWLRIQLSIESYVERHSTLRMIILYLLSLAGCITFAVNFGWIVYWLLRLAFGDRYQITSFMTELSSPISFALTFGIVWAYFSKILKIDILSESDKVRQAAMICIYRYILAMVGLGGMIYGLISTMGYVIDLTTKSSMTWLDTHKSLAVNLAVLIVGAGLWLFYWRKVNSESILNGEDGDHARRSLIRKIYLYLAIFGCVIGTMAATGFLLYTLLQSAFGSSTVTLLTDSLNYLRLILIFAVFLVYHLISLNRDNHALTLHLAEKQASFPVVALFEAESHAGKGLQQAFDRFAGGIPLSFVNPVEQNIEDISSSGAILVSTDLLLLENHLVSDILKKYPQKIIIIPTKNELVIWITSTLKEWDLFKGSALTAKALAEGQAVKPISGSSTWLVISYIIAGLVGFQIVVVLLSLLIGGIN